MKLIVDIPDDDYNAICENYKMLERKGALHSDTLDRVALIAIAKGEPNLFATPGYMPSYFSLSPTLNYMTYTTSTTTLLDTLADIPRYSF